ncbi:hypothetical protein Mal15_08880 [Stieleria maiorica]|uniref:Uncharacterized protein n=1 Tax=Stieleria maiorica TaxID=2795974 RepID=A0A5B9M6N3_9BACT|nr:hypothetical protein [Stieleria maiorica]QEF96858.1 hypothetical protein Mal15_08880 [Stieleria maiorica]
MLKRILFAVAPLVMIFGTVSADDDLLQSLATLDSNLIVAADASAEGVAEDLDEFGQADVDALLGEDDKDEDAVAACFRRVGYGYGYSPSYRSYGYSYGYGYSYYRPTYRYHCYRPVSYSYYHPVTYHVPVYTSYWACY